MANYIENEEMNAIGRERKNNPNLQKKKTLNGEDQSNSSQINAKSINIKPFNQNTAQPDWGLPDDNNSKKPNSNSNLNSEVKQGLKKTFTNFDSENSKYQGSKVQLDVINEIPNEIGEDKKNNKLGQSHEW